MSLSQRIIQAQAQASREAYVARVYDLLGVRLSDRIAFRQISAGVTPAMFVQIARARMVAG